MHDDSWEGQGVTMLFVVSIDGQILQSTLICIELQLNDLTSNQWLMGSFSKFVKVGREL